jgi:hypothetical protein
VKEREIYKICRKTDLNSLFSCFLVRLQVDPDPATNGHNEFKGEAEKSVASEDDGKVMRGGVKTIVQCQQQLQKQKRPRQQRQSIARRM